MTTKPMKQAGLVFALLAAGAIAAFFLLRETGHAESRAHEHAHGGHEEEGHDEARHAGQEGNAGHVELDLQAAQRAGVVLAVVGAAEISETLKLNGKIKADEEHMAHVLPRFPGVVREIRKRLGDAVKKGEILALVESNENLQAYEVASPLTGTVIAKHATQGEAATGEEALFVVADLNTVWIDFDVYRRDFGRLRVGLPVSIEAADGGDTLRSVISYISPFGTENTQTMLARAVVANKRGEWRPGLFVKGTVALAKKSVAIAVRNTALQVVEDKNAVFIHDGHAFEARPVTLGRKDGEWIEVLEGLSPGMTYAAENSFLLKAELGKAGASHEH